MAYIQHLIGCWDERMSGDWLATEMMFHLHLSGASFRRSLYTEQEQNLGPSNRIPLQSPCSLGSVCYPATLSPSLSLSVFHLVDNVVSDRGRQTKMDYFMMPWNCQTEFLSMTSSRSIYFNSITDSRHGTPFNTNYHRLMMEMSIERIRYFK